MEKSKNRNVNWKLISLFLFIPISIIIILFLSTPLISNKTNNVIPTAQRGKLDEQLKEKITSNTNIGISRSSLMSQLKSDGFIFKKSIQIDGQENYISESKIVEIQLLGSESQLVSVSFTVKFKEDIGDSVTALTQMVKFSSLIDKTCTDWLIKYQLEASNNSNSMFNKSEMYCGYKLNLYYFPSDSMTFGISVIK